jgi:hypothetical protein
MNILKDQNPHSAKIMASGPQALIDVSFDQ